MKNTHANTQMSLNASSFNKYGSGHSNGVPEFTPQQVFVPSFQSGNMGSQGGFREQTQLAPVQAPMFFPTTQSLNKMNSLPPATHFSNFAAADQSLTIPVPVKSRSRLVSGDNSDEAPSDASTDVGTSPKNGMKSGRKEFVKEFKRKQKTEMCKSWELHRYCKWGTNCSYAHGEHELVKKTHMPSNYMTKACEQFHRDGFCAYGRRCQFMHSERDIYGNQSYQTVLRECTRIAKAKSDKVQETGNSTQIYINIFAAKKRLNVFETIEEDNDVIEKQDVLSNTSGEKNLFEDFNDFPVKLAKKRTNKKQKKTKLQMVAATEVKKVGPKNFNQQFNDDVVLKTGHKPEVSGFNFLTAETFSQQIISQ